MRTLTSQRRFRRSKIQHRSVRRPNTEHTMEMQQGPQGHAQQESKRKHSRGKKKAKDLQDPMQRTQLDSAPRICPSLRPSDPTRRALQRSIRPRGQTQSPIYRRDSRRDRIPIPMPTLPLLRRHTKKLHRTRLLPGDT